MMVHKDRYLDHPVDRGHRRKDGCFEIRRPSIQDKPIPNLVTSITYILQNDWKIVKELTGVQVLRREIRALMCSNPGHKLERGRKFFQLGVLYHRLWIDPVGEFLNMAERKILECVVLEAGLPECCKCSFIRPLCLDLPMEQGPHHIILLIQQSLHVQLCNRLRREV